MDLSDISAHSRTLEIKHPATGNPTGLVLELVPMEDDRVKAVRRKYQNKAMRGGLSVEDLEEQTFELLAAAIIGWTWNGDLTWNGEKPKYSTAKVIDVLKSKNGPFIIRQVDKALGDEAGFFSE